MAFESGSISFRRFAVIGAQPETFDQKILDALDEHALRPSESSLAEVDYGWGGGRHVLDNAFTFENNVFADALHVAMRIDTNKVPSDLRTAYRLIEEEALAKSNPSGFISKKQKKDAKDLAQRKIDEDLSSGRFRRGKLVPLLWDLPTATVYTSASTAQAEKLQELFERSFGLSLEPLSAGGLGRRMLEARGKRRDYEDARPSRFVISPAGESLVAEYPWVAKGAEAKDFLGNEFVLWLWHEVQMHEGLVPLGGKEAAVFFERQLDLDCVFGQSGRDTLRGDGVTRMPEALDALRSGKAPRKAGLIVESEGSQYVLTLAAETLGISGLKLPNVEEAETPRVLFEERIAMLREFSLLLDALYAQFLKVRFAGSWEGQVSSIRKWILQSARTHAGVMAVA